MAAAGGFNQSAATGGNGGNGGDGLLRMAAMNLTENAARSLPGAIGGTGAGPFGAQYGGGGGGGSGGLYFAACGRTYTLATGATLTCPGGARGPSGANVGGFGSRGRVIVMYGDRVAIDATQLTDAELTTFQLLPGRPFAGLLTM